MGVMNNSIDFNDFEKKLYPYLREYEALIANSEYGAATKLLQHNDELAKYLLIKQSASGQK